MLLDKLFGRRESLAANYGGRYRFSEASGSWVLGATESAAGVCVGPAEALSLSAVFAAVNLISRIKGSLPLSVYRKKSDGSKAEATALPAYKLLHSQPNPEMTAAVFQRTIDVHRLLWGNGYAEIQWTGGGQPAALWPVEPWRVKPYREQKDGDLYFRVDGVRTVAPEDMIHVPNFTTDGVCGQSFIDYAGDSLGLGSAAQTYAAAYFANGARPGGILEHPGNPPDKTRKEMREVWNRDHGGSKSGHVLGLLWGGWKYNPAAGSQEPEKAQLLETRKFSTEEISRWLGVPVTLLAEIAAAGTIEQQSLKFLIFSLGPVLVEYEQEYNRKLLTPPTVYCKHNVNGLLRGDTAARSQFYREQFAIGAKSLNEIRELEDDNPIAGGDVHFVPLNMVPLEIAVEGPPEKDVPPPPADPGQAPPPPPSGVPSPPEPEPMAKVLAAQRSLARAMLAQLLQREASAAVRAAERPAKFLSWMEAFYQDQERVVRETLCPVLEAWFAASPQAMPPAEAAAALAKLLAAGSRSQLLSACECPAAELPARVKSCVEKWPAERVNAIGEFLT